MKTPKKEMGTENNDLDSCYSCFTKESSEEEETTHVKLLKRLTMILVLSTLTSMHIGIFTTLSSHVMFGTHQNPEKMLNCLNLRD